MLQGFWRKCVTMGVAVVAMSATMAVTASTSTATVATTASAATATTSAVSKTSSPPKQLWNLQNADIRAVIHTIAALTGKNFIIDPEVQGNITIVSKKPMSVDELYQMFLSMLQVLNYAAVPSGHSIKIVPATDAKTYAGRVATKTNPGTGDEVVLRVVPVNNVSATQLVPILRPLMQSWGTIMAYNPSNALILAGDANNVTRLVAIIHKMDKNNASTIEPVTLKYANADDLVKILTKLQSSNRNEGKVTNVSYAADDQTNAILVSGSAANIATAKALINRLDIKGASGIGNIEVVHLKYLQAKDMVPILTKLAHGEVTSSATSSKSSSSSSSSTTTTNTTSPLQGLSGGNSKVAIVADKANNSILISAPASTMVSLNRVIKEMDQRPEQVLVEAIVVNVNESLADKLGIQWGTMTDGTSTTDASGNTATASSFQQGIGFLKDVSIKGLLTALKTNSDTDVLATPSVVVLNNQKALISDGVNIGIENRSYATSNTGTTGDDNSGVPFTTTERKDVALKLTVTPQISPNNTVMLKIDQTNQQVDPTGGTEQNPVIDTSEIKTGVLVNNGDILVLGGLIRQDQKGSVSKVPILGDIPILGRLFTYNTTTSEKKNLLVFLKPIILDSRQDNNKASMQRYNYIREQQLRKASGQGIIPKHDPILPRHGAQQTVVLPAPFVTH